MRKGLKQFITFFAGLLFFSTVFAAVVQRNNSKLELYQKRMVFTSDGTATGTLIMDIGS